MCVPSVSDKQEAFMQAVAHNKKFADKVGVPQDVGKEFAVADKEKAMQKNIKNMINKRYGK